MKFGGKMSIDTEISLRKDVKKYPPKFLKNIFTLPPPPLRFRELNPPLISSPINDRIISSEFQELQDHAVP